MHNSNNILVYMDLEDIELWNSFENICEQARLGKISKQQYNKCKKNIFNSYLDKYGILRTKQFFVDPIQWCIIDLMGRLPQPDVLLGI